MFWQQTQRLYTVSLSGTNLWIDLDGEQVKMAFIATRFVRGRKADDAKLIAHSMVMDELATILRNPSNDEPVIVVEKVLEGGPWFCLERRNRGFTWYPDDDHLEA